MNTFLQISGKYLRIRRKRTVLTVIGVVLSMALITGTGTIIESVKRQIRGNIIRDKGEYHAAFTDISPEQADSIASHADVQSAGISAVTGYALLPAPAGTDGTRKMLRLIGSNREAMWMDRIESKLIEGRLPSREGEIVIDQRTASVLGTQGRVGSVLTLPFRQRISAEDGSFITDSKYPIENREFIITGIMEKTVYVSKNVSTDALCFLDNRLYTRKNTVTARVLLPDLKDVEAAADRIGSAAHVAPDKISFNETLLNISGHGTDNQFTSSFLRFQILILAVILTATVAVIFNTFNISYIERIKQFGILRCIGASPRQIRRIIFREAGIISIIGIPLGIVTGFGAMNLIFYVADLLSENMMFEGIRVVLPFRVAATSVLLGILSVFISAYLPARRAGNIPAIEAVRNTGMFTKDRIGKPRKFSNRKRVPPFYLVMAARNIRRDRKRFAVTLFSMVLSVVLYISFSGLLNLTEETNITHDPNLPGFTVNNSSGIKQTVYEDIKNLPDVERVYPYIEHEASINVPKRKLSRQYREYVEALSNSPETDDTFTLRNCRILCYGDSVFDELNITDYSGSPAGAANRSEGIAVLVGESAFINKQGVKSYAPNTEYRAGDTIEIRTVRNGDTLLPLTGITDTVLFDNYNPVESGIDIIVSQEVFTELTGRSAYNLLYVKLKKGAEKDVLTEYLDNLTRKDPDYSYIDAEALADNYTNDFFALSLFFYGFIGVITLIGCVNVINTIGTGLLMRTGEIGIIQAVGTDRRGIRRMAAAESFLYSLYALIIGSAAGTGLWFFLVRTVSNVRETVFTLPLKEIGTAAIGLGFIAFLAGFFPANRITRQSIIENIQRVE